MEPWWVPIMVAVIGGPIVAMIHRFDKRNTQQHGENQQVLNRIEGKIERLDQRVDDHISWHAHNE